MTGEKKVLIDAYESHNGERCDCVRGGGERWAHEGETFTLSENVTVDGEVVQTFELNLTIIEIES